MVFLKSTDRKILVIFIVFGLTSFPYPYNHQALPTGSCSTSSEYIRYLFFLKSIEKNPVVYIYFGLTSSPYPTTIKPFPRGAAVQAQSIRISDITIDIRGVCKDHPTSS